jgi:hypothetical protein
MTQEEVLEIKKGFDLFNRDLGGAIDPKGMTYARTESSHKLPWY